MRFTSLKLQTLRDLYLNELRDLYNAEQQLTRALPQMVEAAAARELKEAFAHHFHETEGHVARLKQIFQDLDEKPDGETCDAMEGLLKEGEIFIEAEGSHDVIDAGLIAAAQRVEHYEIAGYGTVRSLASRLGFPDAAALLQATLDEETAADRKLTSIGESQMSAPMNNMAVHSVG